MKLSSKLALSLITATLVYGAIYITKKTKCEAQEICDTENITLEATKESIKNDVEKTKNFVVGQLYEASKDLSKKNIIKSAKNIQKKVETTSEKIETKINKIANKPKMNTPDVKETINLAKTSIKKELKKAYKDIRNKIIKILKDKKDRGQVLAHASDIRNTTYKACDIIKKTIDKAYENISANKIQEDLA